MTSDLVTRLRAGCEIDDALITEAQDELRFIRDQEDALQERRYAILDGIGARLPRGGMDVEGVGRVEARSPTKRTWQHPDLFRKVTRHARANPAADPTTGEKLDPYEHLMVLIESCAAVSYWRMEALRELGIDPSQYCETIRGPKRAIIKL